MTRFNPLRIFWLLVFFGLICSLATPAAIAKTSRFKVDPALSEVAFTLDPPLRVVGKTQEIKGEVTGNLANPASIRAQFELPLTSLKTGNKRRDKTMCEKCFETDQYPIIHFTLMRILTPKSVTPGTKGPIEIEGTFDLHGVQKKERFSADVANDSERLVVTAQFPLLLSDYKIERPKILFFRVSDKVTVSANLILVKE